MSGRTSKKERQLFRKGMGRELEAVRRRFADILKPKPRFIPAWAWRFMQSRFLNLD